ncbi:MAG: hypothetical protein M0R46_03960 [Candidatus Muirbacterium halophilum]|nr:hypothetical protein [Candidatus Muirbacterium halophilum]MCK9475047.1 hypothetical protein [Candidatus Muirbacterium halophilum]
MKKKQISQKQSILNKKTKIMRINADFKERNQFNIKEAIREMYFNR